MEIAAVIIGLGSELASGLHSGTECLTGLDRDTGLTEGSDEGGWRGGRAAYKSLNPPSELHSPRSKISSPSAVVQWVELLSAILLSTACSLVAGIVASSCTSGVTSNIGYAAILSSDAPYGDGLAIAAGSVSPTSVSSGLDTAQQGVGGLGSGSDCALDRGRTLSRHLDNCQKVTQAGWRHIAHLDI